jgi:hypothetical protein
MEAISKTSKQHQDFDEVNLEKEKVPIRVISDKGDDFFDCEESDDGDISFGWHSESE